MIFAITRIGMVALLLAGCSAKGGRGPIPTAADTIGPGYVTAGGRFDTGTTISVVAGIKNINEFVGICGIWTHGIANVREKDFMRQAASGISVSFVGQTLISDATDFPRRNPLANMTGQSASCFVTSARWVPEYEGQLPEVRVRSFQVRRNKNDQVSFAEAAVPNLVQ